jgi:hypothetical protein
MRKTVTAAKVLQFFKNLLLPKYVLFHVYKLFIVHAKSCDGFVGRKKAREDATFFAY